MSNILGLRVDVDFGIGLARGVPYLLEAFRRRDLRVTFYVTMGPDGFGKHAQRLGSQSYRQRIRRMNPWSILKTFGPVYLMRRAAGVPGNVGEDHPDVLRTALEQGHEVGVHGYDHYWWAEHVFEDEGPGLQHDMELAFRAFREGTGADAAAWASPNWRCSPTSLALLDRRHVPYGADTRGHSPYRPRLGGGAATTPQLPISLPCLHEISDYLDTIDEPAIAREFVDRLAPGYNVWCIHDYYEGLLRRDLFDRVLDEVVRRGWTIVAMDTLARRVAVETLPVCHVVQGRVRGGRGLVSCQGEPVTGMN